MSRYLYSVQIDCRQERRTEPQRLRRAKKRPPKGPSNVRIGGARLSGAEESESAERCEAQRQEGGRSHAVDQAFEVADCCESHGVTFALAPGERGLHLNDAKIGQI